MGFNDGDRGGDRGGGFRGGGFRGGGRGGFNRGGGGGGFRRNFGPRQMFKITCAECGNEGEVPFKPREGTPVLCRDCYAKKNGLRPRNQSSESSDEQSE